MKQLERETITLRARATLANVQRENDVVTSQLIESLQAEVEEARRQVHEQAETKHVLERDLAESQAVTLKYTKKLEDVVHQMAQMQRTADEKVSAGNAEARTLQMELLDIKEKLNQTNSEIINQAAAHLKEKSRLQSELEQTRQVAQVLQNKVSNMDQELAATLEENQQRKSVAEEVVRSTNISSAPGVFMGMIRKTLDQTRTQSPAE